jgi:hypothetical protein
MVDWTEDDLSPVSWDEIEAVHKTTSLQCLSIFEQHRDDLSSLSFQTAVDTLYNDWKQSYGADRGPDQGAAYIFAYLIEAHEIVTPDGFSVAERKPSADELEELFWDEGALGWWIAMIYGVYYSLIMFWMREEEIPLMRRNLSDELLEQIDEL